MLFLIATACETDPINETKFEVNTGTVADHPIFIELKEKRLKLSTTNKNSLGDNNEIIFEQAELLGGAHETILFPVVGENKNINYWISGYYQNKTIRYKMGPATLDLNIEEWAKARKSLKLGNKFAFSQNKPSQKSKGC